MAKKKKGKGKQVKEINALAKIAKELVKTKRSATTGKKGRSKRERGRKSKEAFGGGLGSDLIGHLARPSRSEAIGQAILPTATANKFIPGLTGFT